MLQVARPAVRPPIAFRPARHPADTESRTWKAFFHALLRALSAPGC